MKITDLLLLSDHLNKFFTKPWSPTIEYRMRMIITKDQQDWELTPRAQVLFALKDAEMFRRCCDGEISRDIYNKWTNIFNKYSARQQRIIALGAHTKRSHLYEIEYTANERIKTLRAQGH